MERADWGPVHRLGTLHALRRGQGLSNERSLGDDQLPQKLLEVVCIRGGDKKKSQRDGGPSGGKIRSGPMRNPRLVDEVRKNWRAHEVYSPYLQVTGEFGLGLRFKKFWSVGKTLGSRRTHAAIPTRFSRHDGHSVAERLDRTSVYGRPVKFVGLASMMNHGCLDCAHFGQPDNWFTPWVAVRPGRAGEQALVYYGPGQEGGRPPRGQDSSFMFLCFWCS